MTKSKKLFLLLAVFFFFAVIVFAGGSGRKGIIKQSGGKKLSAESYAPGEVLVVFKKGISQANIDSFVTGQSLKVQHRFNTLSKIRNQVFALLKGDPNADVAALVGKLKKSSQVEAVSPNYRRFPAATHPNDTYYSSYLWGMNNTGQSGGTVDADIDAPEAWDISTGSSSVIVAVIDTGFDYLHPDLAANAWTNPGEIAGNGLDDDGNGYTDDVFGIDAAGWNGSTPDSDPMDGYGHGTHCAGSIGAVGNNSRGVVGVNWNVKIMGLKFMDDDGGNGYDAFAITCIDYAIYEKLFHGQNVVAINASWGGTGGSDLDPLKLAIDDAGTAGIVFCAAAGNSGVNNDVTPHYPSSYSSANIIAVAATDDNDLITDFSCYGATSVDLGAPGADILSTVPGEYVTQAGDLFFDNFEGTTPNWTHGGTRDTWAVSTNVEVFTANPVPSPTHFWSDRPGALYRANTNSWLAYNANINLSGYGSQEIFLGMGTAFNLEYGYDIGYIEISNNGGASWATLATLTGGSHWYSYSWRIPPAYKTNQFRMRFRLQSDSTVQYDGWLIDNVGIKVAPALTFAYESWDGTSMACPHVAGAVGLLASQFGTETVAQRKARILNWGDYNASLDGRTVTCKRLNIYRSLYNPSITVTSPNSGESWMVSSTHNITWTWLGAVNNVNIDYSLDGGTNWTSIASNQPNTGTYSWTIPAVATPQNNCRIRVQEYGCTTSVTDQSDAVFSIIAFSSETVSTPTTPTGPTTGTVGTAYTYSTGGSISNWGDPVQYFFDWDDGSDSGWLAVGTTSAWHSWGVAGTYNVRVMARCGTHTGIVSGWSDPPLAVNQNSHPTWVAVSRFEACVTESQPTVEWHTACEVSPVGFNLWRLDKTTHEYLLVNASFLPALPSSPQGGAYRFADPGASYGEPEIYRLEEVDSQGRVMSYGPFTVTFGGYAAPAPDDPAARMGKEDATDIQGYRRCEREHSPYERERLQARSLDRQKGMALAAAQGREQVRITVKGRGLFYVTSAQVARSLGIPTAQAEALIGKHGLNMTNKGNRVAWLADRNGAGVFFYNDGSVTPYSEQNVYWLERGSGLAMETVNAGNAGPADAGQTYRESLHFEEDHYAMTGVFSSPTADIWLWDYVIAGGAARSFAIEVPGVAAGGMAKLTVTLQGETSTAADNDHHAVVALNGREIGGATWDGSKAHTFEIAFSSTLLSAGANTLSVSGLLDTGAPYSTFYVESFDLEYHRYYQAVNNTLQCRGDGNPVITVGGFTELDVLALDVSRPRLPKLLAGVVPDVSGRVTFIPRAADNDYMLCGLNAAQRPLAVTGDRPATIKGLGNSAEYLVIAPEELEETAQELADYRKGQGLKSLVVSVEDIYEAFNHGIPSPLAIRDFLAYAYNKWTGKKVKYAVLAGKGTYDYNDRLGKGDNLVPVILAKTPDGLFAADKEFGDVKGKDGLPEIAIGRLPVVTNAELRDVIEKIKAYDGSQGGWTGKALMIADNNDGGGDFTQGSDELAGLAGGYPAEKIYLSGSPAETRSRILAAWSAGAGLVNYCGHAGLDRLAQENIFDVAAAIGLRNNGRLPLAVMLTCVAGRFELPGFTSLGEALLLNREGGIAGGMFPSGAGMHADSMRLGTEFYKAALRGQGMTAGQALLAAMKSYLLLGGSPYLLNIYNWIGDPALAYR